MRAERLRGEADSSSALRQHWRSAAYPPYLAHEVWLNSRSRGNWNNRARTGAAGG